MFSHAWSDYEERAVALGGQFATDPRDAIKQIARQFFDYAVADLARYQLMNQRTVCSSASDEYGKLRPRWPT